MLRRSKSVSGGFVAGASLATVAVLLSGAPLGPTLAAQAEEPTFYRDVLPILEANCQVCHQSAEVKTGGMIAPMALETYEQTRPWARVIARKVTDGSMPPWSAHLQHKGTFEGERYLTDEEKQTLVTWAEQGAPAGDFVRSQVNTVRNEEPSAGSWLFGKPDLVVNFAEPVVVGDEVDDWQPIIPVPVTREQHPEARWVRAAELQAGGPYVHHIVSSHLGVGTPGRGPFKFPEGWGILLRPIP
jgi:hypothetical protein